MSRIFLGIYDFFQRHRTVGYSLLCGSFLILLYLAIQVKFEEDINRFFPDNKESVSTETVFKNLKIKDKIIVMFSATGEEAGAEQLIEAADYFKREILTGDKENLIAGILSEIDSEMIGKVTGFIYDYLPIFLTGEDYSRLDSLTNEKGIERLMQQHYRNLMSPLGTGIRSIITRDPLGIGSRPLENLQDFQLTANYSIYDDHLFSEDMSTLILIITPVYGTGTTGKNEILIRNIEEHLAEVSKEYPDIQGEYFGGPSVSVYNARQIQKDTTLTLLIALVIIITFITIAFKSRSAIFLILLPVIYGALFSLAVIGLVKGSISAIAIGAGAAVFGIALSYSIHILSHFNHVASVRQLIEELVYPMTVGSFTTVGAFFGLLFTSSELLRDFGLFSSLALIGTTFFCLVFLPLLLRIEHRREKSGKILQWIEKINGYAYEKNKWLVIGILIVFIISLFLSNRVGFDSNMQNLAFEPAHIKKAERKLEDLFNSDNKTVLFVSVGETMEEGLAQYAATNQQLAALQQQGKINEFASAERILISQEKQQERINQWNTFWTPGKKEEVKNNICAIAPLYGFRENVFDEFISSLDKEYHPFDFTDDTSPLGLMENWAGYGDSAYMFITQVRIGEEQKEEVYALLEENRGLVIFDRAYFANKWVTAINNDFYLILYICSFLIFFALLISYGRIELTLMTFTPMAISWVIILGLMAITGTEFNIVNIILATFIFGLGDDFSIFIMDGLQQEYRTGKKLLTSHKTAIFFSSFTAVVGLGVLIFAKHPALHSISAISFLGMASVVLVSYTILPILFRFFIADPASRGHYPYTMKSLLVTLWFYNTFVIGCSLAIGVASVLILFPVSSKKKKRWFSYVLTYMLRGFLKAAWIAKHRIHNPSGENFDNPAVIVANHQSFIDILILLSLSPKMIMVTNNWVWNSPFFGRIVRYADFVQTAEGYEIVLQKLKRKVSEGYSVVIFPEGTRSADLNMRRFHKGAFYISEELKLDIIPVILYGTGMIISKRQPFYVKRGELVTTILPRIPYSLPTPDNGYRRKTKEISALMKSSYKQIREQCDTPENPWFYQHLITNYIYKGPVEEWYMRVKVKMEHCYEYFNQLIPRKGVITDIGCGFGPLSYMLMLLSDERRVLGIDYDEEKIAVANHNFSRNDRIRFVYANALEYELPESDVFLMNDILHYMDYASQEQLVHTCCGKLKAGGKIIIRDGDKEKKKQHGLTRFTEFLSTRLLKFNKRENDLYFPSGETFRRIAEQYNMLFEEKKNDSFTSNTVYILTKNRDE